MVMLNNIADKKGARHARTRVGRGMGSGKGKTCGRGVKGQKSRSGVAIKGFEGGQMPIFRRLPKRGFTNIHRTEYEIVNLQDIATAIEYNRINSSAVIDVDALVSAGLVRRASSLVKLLSDGEFTTKGVTFEISKASAKAKEKVEAAGSKISFI